MPLSKKRPRYEIGAVFSFPYIPYSPIYLFTILFHYLIR